MAKQEQLDLLQEGIEAWNNWREQHKETAIDLSQFHFPIVNMRGANLREAKFSDSKLFSGDFRDADLREARFFFATLRNADFSQADLSGAEFINADLIEATLINTKLVETDLGGANLMRATLRDSDLRGADLRGADLSEADLRGADLRGATVGWTVFGNLDLRLVKGLETLHHRGPSTIGTDTLSRSHGEIPEIFLRGAGLDDLFISSVQTLAKRTIRYASYFISYTRQDQPFAEQLYASLQREGIRCWFLPEERNGDYKTRDIDEMIGGDEKLLLVLSERSLTQRWLQYEVEQMLRKEAEQQSTELYPLRVDKAIFTCEEAWAKEIKESRQINDFEGWTNPQRYEESFKLLLSQLGTEKK